MFARALVTSGIALAAALTFAPSTGQAHKAVTSKFRYNEDLFPLFRDQCGRCHVEGGVAPMSLMTYDDAAPWGESLRLELLSEEPQPWHVWKLTPRELDMILVWASGGSPKGDAAKAPPAVTLVNTWAAGTPDVTLPMPAPFTLAGAANQATHEVELPLGTAAGRTIGAIDVLPGTPAIVRGAEILLKTPGGAARPLGIWIPGQPAAVSLKTPVTLPAGASLVLRIDYRRTWKYEGQDLTDRSTLGLYAPKPAAARPTRTPGR
jgi:hypothetical protein